MGAMTLLSVAGASIIEQQQCPRLELSPFSPVIHTQKTRHCSWKERAGWAFDWFDWPALQNERFPSFVFPLSLFFPEVVGHSDMSAGGS